MPQLDFKDSQPHSFAELDSPASEEIKSLLEDIQHSHKLRSKLMNLEAWALAETMDNFIPGFWNRFLENRRQALKEFLERKRNQKHNIDPNSVSSVNSVGNNSDSSHISENTET